MFVVGIGLAGLTFAFSLVAKNLDSIAIEICRADYASHPANGAHCCQATCASENANGSADDIKACFEDCTKQITPPSA